MDSTSTWNEELENELLKGKFISLLCIDLQIRGMKVAKLYKTFLYTGSPQLTIVIGTGMSTTK